MDILLAVVAAGLGFALGYGFRVWFSGRAAGRRPT
jgi:hypothetical protein